MLRCFPRPHLIEQRTRADRYQADPAVKIESDPRQISRDEGGRVAPSLDAVIRIETFYVAVDYVVIPAGPRQPLNAPANAVADQQTAFATPPDGQTAKRALVTLVTEIKPRALAAEAS